MQEKIQLEALMEGYELESRPELDLQQFLHVSKKLPPLPNLVGRQASQKVSSPSLSLSAMYSEWFLFPQGLKVLHFIQENGLEKLQKCHGIHCWTRNGLVHLSNNVINELLLYHSRNLKNRNGFAQQMMQFLSNCAPNAKGLFSIPIKLLFK
jgi:hypothetical protein